MTESFTQELQRAVGGLQADLTSIATVERRAAARAIASGEREPDGADWLLGRTAAGAGDAGDGQGPARPRAGAGAFGHRASDGLADRAVPIDQVARHAERALLELVRVGDEAARRPRRAARRFREQVVEEAAGAALGAAEGLAALGQLLADGLREGDAVAAIQIAGQRFAALGLDTSEIRLGSGGIGSLRRAAQRRRRWSSQARSRRIGTPAASAAQAAVRSSEVGPSPPLTTQKSAREPVSSSAPRMSSLRSPTTVVRRNVRPSG